MTRETGLSPRRAPKLSRLPLSPRRTQVRLRPHLFLRSHPPKGGTLTSETPRLGTLLSTRFLTLAYARGPACSRDSSSSHGAARSARVPSCGLNRLRPGFAGSPRFKSSDPSSLPLAALALPPLCAVSTGKLEFPVWKEKLQCKPIFLSTPESVRFLERNTRWPTEAVTPAITNK